MLYILRLSTDTPVEGYRWLFIYDRHLATGVSVGILLQYNMLGWITDTFAK